MDERASIDGFHFPFESYVRVSFIKKIGSMMTSPKFLFILHQIWDVLFDRFCRAEFKYAEKIASRIILFEIVELYPTIDKTTIVINTFWLNFRNCFLTHIDD